MVDLMSLDPRSLDPLLLCTQRRRDLDNMNKLILDALTDIAYEDDS
jgi:Holliday junction resolvase RusA-like endonuclease